MLLIIFDRIGLQKNICPQSHNFAIGTSQPVNDIYLRYSAVVATDQWVVQIIIVQSNGGTVSTNIYTWFWVRSALPKRVWNKCMEYKITKANGDVAWFKLVGGNVNQKEVSYTLG